MPGYGTSSSQEICRVSTVSWCGGTRALGAKEGPLAAGSGSGSGPALGNLYYMGVPCGTDGEVAMAFGVAGLRFCNRGGRYSVLSKRSQLPMCRLSS